MEWMSIQIADNDGQVINDELKVKKVKKFQMA